MTYLLDTPVVSEPTKSRPNDGVLDWLAAHSRDCCISVITLGEVQRGIYGQRDERRRIRLDAWLRSGLLGTLDVLPLDAAIALVWGRLAGESAIAGRTLPILDSLIAATALVHNLTVVTRNVDDFDACGVNTLNPWSS